MKYSHTQFEIMKLESEKLFKAVESIAVFIFSLFTAIFLPQLMFTYLYADQMLTEEPALLKYIPLISFVLGVGYFVFTMILNMVKSAKIKRLQMELVDGGVCDCLGDSDLQEVQSIVDEILAETEKPEAKPKKSSSKKVTSKKKVSAKK